MADIVLWEGGTRRQGDTLYRGGTDTQASTEWPSTKESMGLADEQYILVTVQPDSETRNMSFSMSFSALPATVTASQFLSMKVGLVAARNGTVDTHPYRIEMSIGSSYITEAFTISSGTSRALSLSCNDIAVSLPTVANSIKFTIRDVPAGTEMFIALNSIKFTDSAEFSRMEQFDAVTWYGLYGKTASSSATEDEYIHNYVTRPQEEVLDFDNGDHTVSPLGFPQANSSGSFLDGECDSSRNPVFVGQSFGVYRSTSEDITYIARTNIPTLSGTSIVIPVERMNSYDSGSRFEFIVNGNIGDFSSEGDYLVDQDNNEIVDEENGLIYTTLALGSNASLGIVATGDDPLAGTGLVVPSIPSDAYNIAYESTGNLTYVTVTDAIQSGVAHLGPGFLGLSFSFDSYPTYITLAGQDDPSENGTYMIRSDGSEWRKIATDNPDMNEVAPSELSEPEKYPYADRTAYDNVWACCHGQMRPHFRKGYSERDVHDYVQGKVGIHTSFGTASDNPSCNGQFVNWFVGDGAIDLSQGSGNPVYVNAFGLGELYAGTANAVNAQQNETELQNEPLHPVQQWAISTTAKALDSSSGVRPLPRDWPFTKASDYSDDTCNNNITLVRESATVAGQTGTVGNLDYTDDEGNRVETNRHVITIYNDLKPNSDTEGYDDGTTVIKPTFIHLPAPITTKDGDRVEIEVAIENIDVESAFPGASAKDLSGYHALMSQPRVYVMGGIQNILPERYKVVDPEPTDISSDGYVLTTRMQVADETDTPLSVGTKVRMQFAGAGMTPATTTVSAEVTQTTSSGTKFTVSGEFPYDIGGRGWRPNALSICGIAYVKPNSEIDPSNPTDIDMGLVSRTPEILGSDQGTGEDGAFDQYNRFYRLNGTAEGRYTFPGRDKRYLLATVYQTATNTFPWRLNKRQKLSHLTRLLTDEADRGPNSITAQAWELNKILLNFTDGVHRDFKDLTMVGNAVNLSTREIPVSYSSSTAFSDDESSVFKKLRVTLPNKITDLVRTSDGNPARQARKAYTQLVSDFLSTRCGYGSIADTRATDGLGIDIGTAGRSRMPLMNESFFAGRTEIAYNRDPVGEYDETDLTHNAFQLNYVGDDMWGVKLRHLPEYIRDAYYSTASADFSSTYPDWEGFDLRFSDYLAYSDYSNDDPYAGNGSTSEIGCSLDGTPNRPRRFYERSVVKAIASKTQPSKLLTDMFRFAEMQESWIDGSLRKLNHRYTANVSPEMWSEPWTVATKLFSMDYVPAPEGTVTDIATLPEGQRTFVIADTAQTYRYQTGDSIDIISSTMPTDDALGDFLSGFIPNTGLPTRFHSSARIRLKNGRCDNPKIYKANAAWMERMFDGCDDRTALLNRYINDNFAITTGDTMDRNMGWMDLEDNGQIKLEVSRSHAPYTADRTFIERYKGNGYTRMYMEFTFCARAGRWMTTGYRQYPSCYLSPLYGAETFNARMGSTVRLDGTMATIAPDGTTDSTAKVWSNSMCGNAANTSDICTQLPYRLYSPMDVTLGCVPYMFSEFPYDQFGILKEEFRNDVDKVGLAYMDRLAKAYLPVSDGGLSLFAPGDVNGQEKLETRNGIHANAWSVRKWLRPAVSALEGTDIPSEEERTGGRASDPTLGSMFDFPKPGVVQYHVPDPENPREDSNIMNLIWWESGEHGNIVDHEGTNLGIFGNDSPDIPTTALYTDEDDIVITDEDDIDLSEE